MALPRRTKDPDETLDYSFDFRAETNGTEGADGDWLEDGESIASQVVTIEDGLTEESVAVSADVVTVWVSGGTVGESYKISVKITTDNDPARVAERSLIIDIEEK